MDGSAPDCLGRSPLWCLPAGARWRRFRTPGQPGKSDRERATNGLYLSRAHTQPRLGPDLPFSSANRAIGRPRQQFTFTWLALLVACRSLLAARCSIRATTGLRAAPTMSRERARHGGERPNFIGPIIALAMARLARPTGCYRSRAGRRWSHKNKHLSTLLLPKLELDKTPLLYTLLVRD